MRDIDVAPLPLSHLESHLDEVAVRRLHTSLAGAEALLEGRTVWTVTPSAATSHYIVLMLSVILGFHVISNVTPALHTPLMSVTNAISGIILVGAISQVGHPHPLISAISLAAVVLATINIVGGFAVTHRMLAMFTKD